MSHITRLSAFGIIILLGACSSNGGVDGSGNNSTVGGGNPGGVGNSGGNQGGAAGLGGKASTAGGANLGGQSGTAGTAGTAGTLGCGAAAVCTSTSCGDIVDGCGAVISCGFTNCNANLCGTVTANECTPCTPLTAADCGTVGKNCGPVSDNCFGFIDCGTCVDPECCGCSGVASVCGGANNPLGNSGLKTTCIAGTKGCLCDSTGACAPGLACTSQTTPAPNLCCSGTDCTGSSTSIGSTCVGTGIAACTAGVTVPGATSTTDNCGYPATSFNENAFMCGIFATGGGKDPAQIQAYVNDEWAMTLGCASTANPVSAMPSDPGAVYYPQLGVPTCNDTVGRPMRPTLFITDITSDPNCKTGDQQAGGTAYDPIAIFGTWSLANATGTPARISQAMNYWTLGAGSDTVPANVNTTCPCTSASNCPGSGRTGKGFGTEVRYEAGLISGHSYRLQVIAHDGDQTQGGDAGEYCAVFCAGTGTCIPLTCADYPTTVCGQMPDGCGGLTPECRKCCQPSTCEQACAALPTSPPTVCHSAADATVFVLPCPQSDNCGKQLSCYCPIG